MQWQIRNRLGFKTSNLRHSGLELDHFPQQASGHIFKDDMIGFSSISELLHDPAEQKTYLKTHSSLCICHDLVNLSRLIDISKFFLFYLKPWMYHSVFLSFTFPPTSLSNLTSLFLLIEHSISVHLQAPFLYLSLSPLYLSTSLIGMKDRTPYV